MTPVYQTVQGPKGNCLQAAIASLLDLPLGGVPDFPEIDEVNWVYNMVGWANSRGYGVLYTEAPGKGEALPLFINETYAIGVFDCIPDADGNVRYTDPHAVVIRFGGQIKEDRTWEWGIIPVFDPNPLHDPSYSGVAGQGCTPPDFTLAAFIVFYPSPYQFSITPIKPIKEGGQDGRRIIIARG
jgi:hypothetical protein